MTKVLRICRNLLLGFGLLLVFVIIHETGHTIAARLLGDPESTFYLVKIDENGACLGCNITDHTRLTPTGNLVVSLAGLASTSLAGFGLLALGAWRRLRPGLRTWSLRTGIAYIYLDSLVQGIQGVAYDIDVHTWPTNVDLMDAMLLIQKAADVSQVALKIGLVLVLTAYLVGTGLLFRRLSSRSAL